MNEGSCKPGGDAKPIAEIAKARFGGFAEMFKHNGWPERGQEMISKGQSRVVETYGSVKGLEEHFRSEGRKP